MTEEEFDALAKLPLYDLVDAMRALGCYFVLNEDIDASKPIPAIASWMLNEYRDEILDTEPQTHHWPLALRESIQEEWDW